MSTPILEPVRPAQLIETEPQLWTCSPTGEQRTNITRWLESAVVTINHLNEIKGSLRAVLRRGVPATPIEDCLMPVAVVQWRDSAGTLHRLEESLGVYSYLPPDEDFTGSTTRYTVEGMDNLFRLSQQPSPKLHWFGTGVDYGEAASYVLQGVTPLRLDLPRTASSIVTPWTVLPNQKVLKAANDLYMAGDYWDLSADRFGTISTSRRTVLGQSSPARVIDSRRGDVLGISAIQRRPDRNAFFNQVFISSTNPEADLTLRNGYRVSLVDPDSRFNIYKVGVWPHEIADSQSESFQTVRNRAILALEGASSMQRRATFPVWPDPRWGAREAWECHIFQNDGFAIIDGMARVEEMTFGLTENSFAQLVTVSELANIDDVVEGEVAA